MLTRNLREIEEVRTDEDGNVLVRGFGGWVSFLPDECGPELRAAVHEAESQARTTVRAVKVENAELTVHIPTEFDNIHDAIEKTMGVRHVEDYDIRESYEIEKY